jgi:hypothetical protein
MVLDHLVLRDLQGTLPLPRTGEGYSRSLSPQLEPGTSPKQEEGLQSPHTHTHTLISRRDPQGGGAARAPPPAAGGIPRDPPHPTPTSCLWFCPGRWVHSTEARA